MSKGKKVKNRRKCLILCLGCNDQYTTSKWENIRQTWGKDIIDGKYEDIDILYYTASYDSDNYLIYKKHHDISVPVNDRLIGTFDKTVKTIQAINMLGIEYDCILKIHSSTIVNVKLLDKFIHSDLYDPNKIYTSELYIGGWKAAPKATSFVFRGNFVLMDKKYVNLINHTSLEMVKQFNDWNRYIHKDLFYYDDLAISAIMNTYIAANNLNRLEIYQRVPIQYLNNIYERTEALYANNLAFFNKTFGDIRSKEEQYHEQIEHCHDFYEKFYNLLTDDLNQLEECFNDLHFVEEHSVISENVAEIHYLKYEDLTE